MVEAWSVASVEAAIHDAGEDGYDSPPGPSRRAPIYQLMHRFVISQ